MLCNSTNFQMVETNIFGFDLCAVKYITFSNYIYNVTYLIVGMLFQAWQVLGRDSIHQQKDPEKTINPFTSHQKKHAPEISACWQKHLSLKCHHSIA